VTSSQNRHGNRDVTATTSRRCHVTSSDWTPCSRSCDVGTSIRLTNDNEDCRMQTQVRLCLVRPCAVRFPDVSFYSHFTIITLTSRRASLHVCWITSIVGPNYAAAYREAAAIVNRYLLCCGPALSSKPSAHRCCCRLTGRREERTDTRPLHRPCSAYCAGRSSLIQCDSHSIFRRA